MVCLSFLVYVKLLLDFVLTAILYSSWVSFCLALLLFCFVVIIQYVFSVAAGARYSEGAGAGYSAGSEGYRPEVRFYLSSLLFIALGLSDGGGFVMLLLLLLLLLLVLLLLLLLVLLLCRCPLQYHLPRRLIDAVFARPKIGAHGKPVVFLHPKSCNSVLVELEQS